MIKGWIEWALTLWGKGGQKNRISYPSKGEGGKVANPPCQGRVTPLIYTNKKLLDLVEL